MWVHIVVVIALVMTQMVFVSEPARSSNHVTGQGSEIAVKDLEFNFTDLEINEQQSVSTTATAGAFRLFVGGVGPTAPLHYANGLTSEVQTLYNNATGGTFTITFQSETTAPIAYNASAAVVKGALEALTSITTVSVSGAGTFANPWSVIFLDPGGADVGAMVGDDGLLLPGGSTTTEATVTQGGQSMASALEALSNVDNVVSVSPDPGAGPWTVTFQGAVKTMTASDALSNGTTTVGIVQEGRSAPIDPSGIAFLGSNLLVADSEINEEPSVYDGVNVWELSTVPAVVSTAKWEEPSAGSTEPTGLDIDLSSGHLYISDDNQNKVYDVILGDGKLDNPGDSFTTFNASANGIADPEDVAWDSAGGQLFVASGVGMGSSPLTVTAVHPGPNGRIGSGGDDVVGPHMDFSSWMGDLEGLGYRAFSDTLLMVDPTAMNALGTETIIEITKDGRLVRYIRIQFTDAPSDVIAVGAQGKTLWVVDRGNDNNSGPPPPRDGRLFKLSVPFNNLAPYVDAGSNQVVGFGDPASLVGDSYDDGQGSNYTTPPHVPTVTWSKMSGPGTVNFTAPNSLATNATFSLPGTYELKLTSSDGSLSNSDIVQVTMSADPNQAPTANAGPDQVITLPSAANLSGTANDDGMPNPPGTVTTQWSKDSGPGTVTFGNASALMTTASFSEAGTYVLKLTANDSAKQHSDTMTVTVNPAPPDASIVGGVQQSTGIWSLFDGGVLSTSFYFGNPNDFPFYGDWDCDGDETPGLYRQSDGYVYLRNSNTQGIADISFFFGNPGDVPIAGDFDGDGCDTVSIYRPSEAKFYIINELGSADKGLGAADYSFFYGVIGDAPFVGDWTGNGVDTPGLRRNSDGFVYLRNTNTQGVADVSYFYGNSGDVVFTGDWDADGDDTLGLYRPSNGVVYLRNTNSTGIADMQFPIGSGMYPVAGDQ